MTQDVKRHPGPFIGPDAELARACAIAAIKDYGDDDPQTYQRIMTGGIWNDHVAVQAAFAAIYNLRASAAALGSAIVHASPPLMDAGSICKFISERWGDGDLAGLANASRALADHLRVLASSSKDGAPT